MTSTRRRLIRKDIDELYSELRKSMNKFLKKNKIQQYRFFDYVGLQRDKTHELTIISFLLFLYKHSKKLGGGGKQEFDRTLENLLKTYTSHIDSFDGLYQHSIKHDVKQKDTQKCIKYRSREDGKPLKKVKIKPKALKVLRVLKKPDVEIDPKTKRFILKTDIKENMRVIEQKLTTMIYLNNDSHERHNELAYFIRKLSFNGTLLAFYFFREVDKLLYQNKVTCFCAAYKIAYIDTERRMQDYIISISSWMSTEHLEELLDKFYDLLHNNKELNIQITVENKPSTLTLKRADLLIK